MQNLQGLCSDRSPLWQPVGIFHMCHPWLCSSLCGLFLHIVRSSSSHLKKHGCVVPCAHISCESVAYSKPSVGLLFALYSQHQCVSIGQSESQFMVLPLAVFGCIDHSALWQQQVHIGACVLRTLIALGKGGYTDTLSWKWKLQRLCMYPKCLISCLPVACSHEWQWAVLPIDRNVSCAREMHRFGSPW